MNGSWSTATNWLGDPAAPGSISLLNSADVATFNSALANTWGLTGTPIVIDSATQNIGGLNFTGAAGNFFIGTTGGNALRLSSGGSIQILSGLTATNALETINAPLVIQGASGTYTITNNSANGSGAGAGTLNIGGDITGGAAGATILTLSGSNTNNNTISGSIANGTATSLAVTKSGIGTWILSGSNAYTGATRVNGGKLVLAFGTVASNIISSNSALTLSGGTLQLTGTGTQIVNGLTTTASTGSRILMGSNQTLTLGALTSAGAGSALNFNTSEGGASGATVGTGVVVLTGQTEGAEINSGFTVTDSSGFGLATVNASNQIIRLTSTTLMPVSGATSATNYLFDNNSGGAAAAGSSSLAITASESALSLTVDTTAASGVVTLGSGVVLSTNIMNFGGTGSNNWQISGSAGGAGLQSTTTNSSIEINNFSSGTVTLAAPILAFGSNVVNVKGTGTTVFSGANIYTGGDQRSRRHAGGDQRRLHHERLG